MTKSCWIAMAGTTVNDLLVMLFARWPKLAEWDASLLIAVDQTYVKRDTTLNGRSRDRDHATGARRLTAMTNDGTTTCNGKQGLRTKLRDSSSVMRSSSVIQQLGLSFPSRDRPRLQSHRHQHSGLGSRAGVL